MAKGTKAGAILVKLVSTAATGFFYVKVSERGSERERQRGGWRAARVSMRVL